MKNLKRLMIALVTVSLLGGCAPKEENATERHSTQPKVSETQNTQESGPPSQVAEANSPSEAQDYSEGYSGVIVPNHTISETSRVGSGIALMVGGSLTIAAGYGSARLSDKLVKIYSAMTPGALKAQSALQTKLMNDASRFLKKIGYGKNRTARRTLIRKLLMSSTAKDLGIKRVGSKAALWGSRAAMVGGTILTGLGIAELVLETTELGNGEPTAADRFEDLKHSVYTLAADPENVEKQDRMIYDVLAYLPDVINALKFEYNTQLSELVELKAQGDTINAEDLKKAEEEFMAYAEEHRKTIEFFEKSLETLQAISAAEKKDRKQAQDILNSSMEALNKIYGEKDEKKEEASEEQKEEIVVSPKSEEVSPPSVGVDRSHPDSPHPSTRDSFSPHVPYEQ